MATDTTPDTVDVTPVGLQTKAGCRRVNEATLVLGAAAAPLINDLLAVLGDLAKFRDGMSRDDALLEHLRKRKFTPDYIAAVRQHLTEYRRAHDGFVRAVAGAPEQVG